MGFVYFIHAVGTGRVKIGVTTKSPSKRLESMQTGSPYPLEVYGYIESSSPRRLERKLHKRFKDQRRHGEWFELPRRTIEATLHEHGADMSPDYVEISKDDGSIYLYYPQTKELKIPLKTLRGVLGGPSASLYWPAVKVVSSEYGPLIDYDVLVGDWPDIADELIEHKEFLISEAVKAAPFEW